MKPEWKTYNVDNLHQDAVIFLFDMLYEKRAVFKGQYWLGELGERVLVGRLTDEDVSVVMSFPITLYARPLLSCS